MSIRALAWAFDQIINSPHRKFVLVALANHCSDSGLAYPGVKTIVDMTGMSDDGVRKALAKLEAEGIISDTGKKWGATAQVKVYRLPDEAWQRPVPSGSFKWQRPVEDPGEDPSKTRQRPVPSGSPNIREPGTLNQEPLIHMMAGRFKVPTVEAVKLHAAKLGLPDSEAEKFWHYYESNGWRVGRNPMKSWEAAMVNWRKTFEERNGRHQPPNGSTPTNGVLRPNEIRLVIEAKQTQAQEIKHRYCSECAMGDSWSDREQHRKYLGLIGDIKTLNAKLASYA